MTETDLYPYAVLTQVILGVSSFIALFFVTAPYGRHAREGWGRTIPSRWGWVLMESPAVVVYISIFMLGEKRFELVPLVLLGMWQWHYFQRTFVFPFLLAGGSKPMPITIPLMALVFNTLNAYINARWLSHFSSYTAAWLLDPRFIFGAALFFSGWTINVWADRKLIALRKTHEGYSIPHGGLYARISCPNYFGEILEWIGFAIAAWSWAGAAFAFFTFCNLAPRAFSNHRWYQEKFPDYPRERKALIPFVV